MKRFIAFLALTMMVGSLSAQELIPTPVEVSYKGNKRVKIEKVDAKVDSSLDLPEEGYTLEIKGTTAVVLNVIITIHTRKTTQLNTITRTSSD